MTITGLEQDNYLINNPIWITATNLDSRVNYLEVTLSDITVSGTPPVSRPLRIYPYQGKLHYNLQDLIKGNFPASL